MNASQGWSLGEVALVEQARTEARPRARYLARKYDALDANEILALIEDALLDDVKRFDPSRGPSLLAFARRRIARDVFRAAHRRVREPASVADLGSEQLLGGEEVPAHDEAWAETEERERLWKVVGSLGDEALQVARLLYVEDRSYEEAAGELGLTAAALKYREKVLLAELRRKL